METDGDIIAGENPNPNHDGEESVDSLNLFLDQVGEVSLTLNSDALSWKLIECLDKDGSTCLGVKLSSKSEICIKFSDVYAVEYINFGLVREPVLANASACLLGRSFEMHRFTVHTVQRSKTQTCQLVPTVYTFGHNNSKTCQIWVNKINAYIEKEAYRPKSLLVFVHPRSGKGNGFRIWESVAPIFSRAKVKTKVTITQRAGHAYDVMASITNKELSLYDGVVAVGGDGFFNELLNGLLLSRHKAPYPPAPADFAPPNFKNDNIFVHDNNDEIAAEHSHEHNEDQSPLLLGSNLNGTQVKNFRTADDSCETDKDPEFSFPNERFRFGIIPSGSTDAIVICTTGIRDPVTSALQIVLGKRVSLDIAQIVRWKSTSTSEDELYLRYAASFAGYGFYGDVIKESEKYRWMGPKRYDYAGTKVFLKHRSYEAEVAYLESKSEKITSSPNKSVANSSSRRKSLWNRAKKSDRVICRVNCKICNSKPANSAPGEPEWGRSKGCFLSVGAAVMSNRNEKAPDGLVADAHLSDGFLHLILIKDCPHALYLWHLTQLAKKGGTPLDFEFVEHHKTTAFTFTSFGKESLWNVDGELFKAHKLSAQVFRGLINLFATGPQV